MDVNNTISINQHSDIDLIVFPHQRSLKFKAVVFYPIVQHYKGQLFSVNHIDSNLTSDTSVYIPKH